jgi:hypothetical protein
LAALVLITAVGCDELDQAAGKGPPAKPGLSPVGQQFVPLDENAPRKQSTAQQPAPQPPDNKTPTTMQPGQETAPGTEKVEAGQNSPVKELGEGYVETPVKSYFYLQDRMVFDVQIPKQLQLYKADHNNRFPKDANEYYKYILDSGSIKLPEAPPGKVYVYNPKDGDLYLIPAKQSDPNKLPEGAAYR